jgi:recombination protein RecT
MTVSQAVTNVESGPEAIVRSYTSSFAEVLPATAVPKPAAWVGLVIGALRKDRNLAKVAAGNIGSLMDALMNCARLGLDPGTEQFWLVPFGNQVQGIVGWQGHVELMYRAGAVSSVKAEVVRSNDTFEFEPASMDRPVHKVDWFGDRGDLLGVYAYAALKDGTTSKVVVLGKPYLDKVRAESRGSDKASSPWQKWPEAMMLKTAVKRLSAWVPTSSEFRAEMMQSAAAAAAHTSVPVDEPDLPALEAPWHVDTDTGELTGTVDAELVEDES